MKTKILLLSLFLINKMYNMQNLKYFVQKKAKDFIGKGIEEMGTKLQDKGSYFKTYKEAEAELKNYFNMNGLFNFHTPSMLFSHIKDYLEIFAIIYPEIQGETDKEKIDNLHTTIQNLIQQKEITIPQTYNIIDTNITTKINTIIENNPSGIFIDKKIINQEEEKEYIEKIYLPLYNQWLKKIDMPNNSMMATFAYFKNIKDTYTHHIDEEYTKIIKAATEILNITKKIISLQNNIDEENKKQNDEIKKLEEENSEMQHITQNKKDALNKTKRIDDIKKYGNHQRNIIIKKNVENIKETTKNMINTVKDFFKEPTPIKSEQNNENREDDVFEEPLTFQEYEKLLTDKINNNKKMIERLHNENKKLDECKKSINTINIIYEKIIESLQLLADSQRPNTTLKTFSVHTAIIKLKQKFDELNENSYFQTLAKTKITTPINLSPFSLLILSTKSTTQLKENQSIPTSEILNNIMFLAMPTELSINQTLKEKMEQKIKENMCQLLFERIKEDNDDTTRECKTYSNAQKNLANFLTMHIILQNLHTPLKKHEPKIIFTQKNNLIVPQKKTSSNFLQWIKYILKYFTNLSFH